MVLKVNSLADMETLNGVLQPICGLPLTSCYRAYGQVFQFGEQKPATDYFGDPTTQGDHLLKFIASDWRVVRDGRVILGSTDYYEGSWFFDSEDEPRDDCEKEARRLAIEFLNDIERGRYVVQNVTVEKFADVRIVMSEGLEIQSFNSSADDSDLLFFSNMIEDSSWLI